MKKCTPVMVVPAIEPVLPFWVDRLGFDRTVEVPHGDRLGFVILARDGVELMYQTEASVADDLPAAAGLVRGHTPLFIEVADLKAVQAALTGVETLVAERTTFYGATETVVVGPEGQLVTFAQFGAGA